MQDSFETLSPSFFSWALPYTDGEYAGNLYSFPASSHDIQNISYGRSKQAHGKWHRVSLDYLHSFVEAERQEGVLKVKPGLSPQPRQSQRQCLQKQKSSRALRAGISCQTR